MDFETFDRLYKSDPLLGNIDSFHRNFLLTYFTVYDGSKRALHLGGVRLLSNEIAGVPGIVQQRAGFHSGKGACGTDRGLLPGRLLCGDRQADGDYQ